MKLPPEGRIRTTIYIGRTDRRMRGDHCGQTRALTPEGLKELSGSRWFRPDWTSAGDPRASGEPGGPSRLNPETP
ncbi:hypothetical protein Psuf_011320 [Phytohabitans suffuscus]|uniref:Uncharacterized protein n=1 Tax=Phytohabitans suffuscus TaxID=624315 RepID=A0A6F8YCR7_9ACTN|nr:hypothetical protein Psuf_011320 [Phytohabitans suffuscus]